MSSPKSSNVALLSAVKKVDYNGVKELLNKHGLIKNEKWNDYKILIHAVHIGHLKIVQLLLSYGCRVKSSRSNSCKTPLCYAVKNYNLEMIKILLEAGASITDKDSNVDTPLYMAMKQNFLQAVDLMLSVYDVKNIDVTNNDEIIHFYIACIRNDIKLIKSFIACGMNVNTYVDFHADMWPGYSPLHFAVKYQNVKAVKLLLSYGANYTFLNADKSSPLHLAINLEDSVEKYQIMDYILFLHTTNSANPIDEKGVSHFHIACTRHNKDTVLNFLKNGADVNSSTFNGLTSLDFAVSKNQKEIVEILLKHGANVNTTFKNSTPLHASIGIKSLFISKLLLSYGANICAEDDNNCTPIHKAFDDLANCQEILNTMMSMHQGKMKNIADKKGLSIFHIACAVGDVVAVKNFLTRNVDVNASLNAGKLSGFTGLHFAAINYHEDVVKLLLKYKVNVNALDKNERSAISLAVQCTLNETIVSKLNETLLKNKSDYKEAGVTEKEVMDFMHKQVRRVPVIKLLADSKSHLNRAPLLFQAYNPRLIWEVKNKIPNRKFVEHICAKYNIACRKEIIEIFVQNGIGFYVPGENSNSILHSIAADADNNESLEIAKLLLINGCNPNFRNGEGKTALHLAAQEGCLEYAKLLLKYKANPNCIDNYLLTPLHYAAAKSVDDDNSIKILEKSIPKLKHVSRHTNIMQLLLDNGANVDAKDIKGRTPLFLTVLKKESRRALLCLLKANCQVNICNNQGQSALFLAGRSKNACGVKLLLDYGADITFTFEKNKDGLLKQVFSTLIKQEMSVFDFIGISFVETFKVLEMHIEKLRLIGYQVHLSDLVYRLHIGCMLTTSIFSNILDMIDIAVYKDRNFDLAEKDNFITPALEHELEKLKDTKIDHYTSLYDVLFKNEKQMVKHINNETFNEYLQEKTLHKEFQHYGYLLRLKYKQGMERYVLLEPAKQSMMQLIGQNLPDLCFDNIFAYLCNDNLKKLIDACV